MKFDLKYFIHRTNSLLVYREAIKFTSKIKETTTKNELRQYIRYEFETNINTEDPKKKEYLIATARKKINTFKETYFMSN